MLQNSEFDCAQKYTRIKIIFKGIQNKIEIQETNQKRSIPLSKIYFGKDPSRKCPIFFSEPFKIHCQKKKEENIRISFVEAS
ncbi:hypothetical protein DLM78_08205 [Leptospira stimsonii]|uniref:Uncharacterized protein n=1 Tax=Leptospira stimsonii TaxID=2202203 RepID=A0A8B3CXR7_9LEPT|nr:hypothetical protein DLM78_08205 [Leptospira stimsonii]